MDLMIQRTTYILFWVGFCHIVQDFPIQPINYIDFTAYPVIEGCPLDKNAWENASEILNCMKPKDGFKNLYHCMPNRRKTMLLEFCYPRNRPRMSPGLCFVLADNGLITNYDDTNCTDFINNSCHMSYDGANMMYKYPACLKINPNKGCYTSDPACPNVYEVDSTKASETTIDIPETSGITNSSIENQGHPAEEEKKESTTLIIIIIASFVVVVGGVIAWIIYQFCYKKNRICIKKGHSPEEIGLLEVPSLVPGDITLDPEVGVKICASLLNESPSIKSTTWIKDGTVIDFEKCHGKYSTDEKDQHLSLIIHNMDHRDQGEYSCYVTSNTGRVSEPVIFNLGAAKVTLDFINSIPLGEVRCAKLTASSNCKVLDVLWQKDDGNKTEYIRINHGKYSGNVFTSRQEINLYINDVNESDAGNYLVIVKTEYGLGVSNQKELEVLQENKDSYFEEWKRENHRFVCTSASTSVKELLESNNIVIITGKEGSGKSAIAHHVGLYLKETKGYRIIPLSHVKDIFTFCQSKSTNVCFIIDDPFGRTVLDISKMFHYISILPCIQSAKHVRLLMSVSWPISDKIFRIEKIASCAATINLSLEPLTEIEKDDICKAYYVPVDVREKISAKENFPLLCSLYAKEKFICQGRDFIPEYEKHVEENLSKNQSSILALFVLCLFNNNILNSVAFQNAAIMEWICTYFEIGKEELYDAFKSLTSAITYLETSSYGDCVHTVQSHMILEVVLGLIKQMLKPTLHLRRIPSHLFGLFARKLEPSSFDIYFYLNSLNLCDVFQSDAFINLLEQVDLSGNMHLNDWYEVFLSENVYDMMETNSDIEINISKTNLEFYGYTLLFSIEANQSEPDERKRILKTKVLWWVTKFGSVPLLQKILQIKDERFLKELDRLLMISCFSNSVEKTQLVIKHGKEVKKPDADSFVTPVVISFYRKNEKLLSLLKKEGAKLDDMEINGKTLLSESILIHDEDSDLKFRKFLAKEVADIDKVDKNGETALFIASKKGDLELVKFFIKRKADVNKVGPDNRTPLFVAAEKDCYEIVKELVKNYARIDRYDSHGRSSLHEASKKGNLKMVKYLVNSGAKVNKLDENKSTPLHLAVESKQFKVAKYLLSQNANVNDLDNMCQSPLFIAAKLGQEKILDLLIRDGGDVNVWDCKKNTPLHAAIRCGNTKIVKRLLASDANTNISDKDFNRPLHLASSEEKIDIVKLLLKKNTDVNVTNKRGQTPLLIACIKGNYEIVKELVTSDTSVNLVDSEERTPLHEAAKEGFKEIVEYLVKEGAISNINANDKNNRTPLYCACECGNTEIIRHLLKKGAIVHLCDRNNVTPLILVSKTGPLENVKLIVEHLNDQSQINRCDNEGKSPLHYAVSAQLVDVVAYLKEKKADIQKKDDSGKTPFDIACENNFQDVIEILNGVDKIKE